MAEKDYVIVRRDPDPDMAVMPFGDYTIAESGGSRIYGRVLHPARKTQEEIGPAVLMMHGQPGGDKNMDLAEYFCDNGFTAVTFSYRGVWGSEGYYCLSHLIEDTIVMAGYIRKHAEAWHVDPERLFLFGHSMGGFASLNAMAAGLKVKGAVLMAPCDIGYKYFHNRVSFDSLARSNVNGYFTIPSEDYIFKDAEEHAENWHFPNLVPKLDPAVPIRFIGGAKDQTTPPVNHILPVKQAMEEKGFDVGYTELLDGHMFPLTRIRLAITALEYLKEMDR